MRLALRLLAALLLVSGTVLMLGSPAHAAQLVDKGWWWRLGLVGPPAQVPEGGLYVQGAPDGAMAIAAVSFTLAQGEANPVLELKAAEGNPPVAGDPILLACQAGASWSGEEQGDWAAKPPPACDVGSVQGQHAEDGTWTFPLAPLQINDKVNVVLVPGVVEGAPEGLNGSTFQVAFEPPTASSLKTSPGVAPPPPALAPEAVNAEPVNEPAAVDNGGSFDTGGGSFDPGAETGAEAALPEDEQGLTATAPVAQEQGLTPPPPAAAPADDDDRGRLALGLGVIILGVGAGWVATRVPAEPLRSLSRFGSGRAVPAAAATAALATSEPTTGGLGRFARTRHRPAPQL